VDFLYVSAFLRTGKHLKKRKREKRGMLYNPFYRSSSFKAKFLCMNMNEKPNENESTLLDSFIGNFL